MGVEVLGVQLMVIPYSTCNEKFVLVFLSHSRGVFWTHKTCMATVY